MDSEYVSTAISATPSDAVKEEDGERLPLPKVTEEEAAAVDIFHRQLAHLPGDASKKVNPVGLSGRLESMLEELPHVIREHDVVNKFEGLAKYRLAVEGEPALIMPIVRALDAL